MSGRKERLVVSLWWMWMCKEGRKEGWSTSEASGLCSPMIRGGGACNVVVSMFAVWNSELRTKKRRRTRTCRFRTYMEHVWVSFYSCSLSYLWQVAQGVTRMERYYFIQNLKKLNLRSEGKLLVWLSFFRCDNVVKVVKVVSRLWMVYLVTVFAHIDEK